jgi:MFS family permease
MSGRAISSIQGHAFFFFLLSYTYDVCDITEGASYMFGRATSSIIWGIVADKHGRKPVIVITLIAV